MRKYALWSLIVVSLLANIILAYFAFIKNDLDDANTFIKKYPLVSKRLALEDHNDVIVNFDPLRKQVQDYLKRLGVEHSFYFEYLPSGVNVRDGEGNQFVGASLLKVPLVMDLYRASELGLLGLDDKITLPANINQNDKEFGNTRNLQPGSQITLREAVQITLEESDNTTAILIRQKIDEVYKGDSIAFRDLDLDITTKSQDGMPIQLIGSKSYSSILKCLYLACALTPENSQEILDFLSKSTTLKRVESGVPTGLIVANKIGAFSEQVQSDCAIVYQPNRPYMLCMMFIPGNKNIEHAFKDLSSMVYNYVVNH